MMMDEAGTATAYMTAGDYHKLDRLRRRYSEVFGRECMLRDDVLMKRYNLSLDGELVMFIR